MYYVRKIIVNVMAKKEKTKQIAKQKPKKQVKKNEQIVVEEKPKNKAKSKKPMSKGLKALIQYGIIGVSCIGLGVGGGIFLKRKLGQAETDYSGFNPELFKADAARLLKEYRSNPSKSFTPAELVNIGLEKYREFDNSYSVSVGLASTVVKQTIRNYQIKNGSSYFEESISRSSMVSLASRSYQLNSDQINYYAGSASSDEQASYDGSFSTYSPDAYKDYLGMTLEEMFVYLISNDTVNADQCSVTKTGGLVKVTLSLDIDIATYFYKIRMKSMSNLNSLPSFEYVTLKYTFDNDMTLLHLKVDEKYKASMSGVTATIVNDIDTYYHAGEYRAIPELNEAISYSTKGETKYE